MNQELLQLVPKRFLCPYCGQWHDWDSSKNLKSCDSITSVGFKCLNLRDNSFEGCYTIFFKDGYCYCSSHGICDRTNFKIVGMVTIESISESSDKPIVTFKVPFRPDRKVGLEECSNCKFRHKCNLVSLACQSSPLAEQEFEITLGFEFEQSDYSLLTKQKKENKENTTMSNNLFNMNMEFGPNKDENIASTIMGVAVKNGDSWRIYDKKKKEITDVGDMQLGNLPIFILPTTKLSEGDLIKDAGEYYFVTSVATSDTPTQTLSARTGEMKSVVPIKNILGFSCYSKVVALSDSLNMGNDFDVEKLAIMSAMCSQTGQDGSQMNQLLPLMLFKDKFGGDDDKMKLLLMSSMMASKEDGSQMMNQLLPLMLFKDELGGDDDKTKLLLISSMMGGNTSDSNKMLMSYLMLDTFMGKKEDKAPKKTDEGTTE